jgi:hypothetical protein
MAYGPVEFVVIAFPGNQFSGEIAPAIVELVEQGTVRIIDLFFVTKDGDGTVGIVELDGFGDAAVTLLQPVAQTEDELLSASDGEYIGALLEPNSSALLILFENAWAARFAQAVRNANGHVLLNERIPGAVIEEVLGADE